MKWLRTILREILGLFVDDGSFAVAIVVWLLVVRLVVAHVAFVARWSGFLLFGGLAVMLAESALRFARRRRRV